MAKRNIHSLPTTIYGYATTVTGCRIIVALRPKINLDIPEGIRTFVSNHKIKTMGPVFFSILLMKWAKAFLYDDVFGVI